MTVTLPRQTRLLYAGVAVFLALAAFTAHSIWTAWRERSGDARAGAVFDLVGQRTSSRPTDAPGAMAWLRLQLDVFAEHLDSAERTALYRRVAAPADRVPDELRDLADALTAPAPGARGARPELQPAPPASSAALRRERVVAYRGEPFAVTRRRGLDTVDLAGASSSNRFLEVVVPRLRAARLEVDRLAQEGRLPVVPGPQPPRPVRVYAVAEDGTLVSSPWPDGADDRHAVDRELALFAARPLQPTFAPDPFFFRFDLASPAAARDGAYSGFYLDLGGRGLVSTVMRPLAPEAGAPGGILAADLSFDVDWPAFAAAVAAPVESAAVLVRDRSAPFWTVLARGMPAAAAPDLRAAVTSLAAQDVSSRPPDDRPPLQHAIVRGAGAVAAFQMSDETWLVMRFPQRAPVFPVTAVLLLAGVLATLLAGFEINRRRADRERVRSERALAEKQNLLNTMQVPLVVVDPNTDAIVSANRAAAAIGIRAGGRFADIVWPDDRARAHYARMQAATAEPRRAYGVPVAVHDEHGQLTPRYAVVRSVAVTAPIDALAADERHRLGVLFLLEPEADLALLTDDLESSARRDERRRLAGLLSHGVDTLARVLEHALRQPDAMPAMREFTTWLSDYLERRIRVAAWLLDHWDATPPLPPDSVVDRDQLTATIDRWRAILVTVAADRGLRVRLHWDNGVLSLRSGGPSDPLETELDWPATLQFTTPVRGAFGMFLGEAIANAVRHGAPGSIVHVRAACDRVRRELAFEVVNATAPQAPGRPAPNARVAHGSGAPGPMGDSYGGLAMLDAIARLCDWRDLQFTAMPGEFRVSWRVPVSERGTTGAD
jgi:hypothetical protein